MVGETESTDQDRVSEESDGPTIAWRLDRAIDKELKRLEMSKIPADRLLMSKTIHELAEARSLLG